MKTYKFVIYLAAIVSIVSALSFVGELAGDFPNLFNKSYLEKQDYVEQKYNSYQVYRYYDWIRSSYPRITEYSLLTAPNDDASYVRYLHRMNYFLFPSHIKQGSARALFAPKLDSISMARTGGQKYVVVKGKRYYLIATKDKAGLFILK